MQFMFETAYQMKITDYGMDTENQDVEYYNCWEGITKHFDKNQKYPKASPKKHWY